MNWKKWSIPVIAAGIVIAGYYTLGYQPTSAVKTYNHAIVEGRIDESLSGLIGQAKHNVSGQKGLLKTKGNILEETYTLKDINLALNYAVVDADVTVGLPDGMTDREHQLFELIKLDGTWKISKVESRSMLEISSFYIPAWFIGGAKETLTQYLNDQLAGSKDAIHWLTGDAYTTAETSQPIKMTPMELKDLQIQPLGRDFNGGLLLKASYNVYGSSVPQQLTQKRIELLVRMEKVGGVWKLATLESL